MPAVAVGKVHSLDVDILFIIWRRQKWKEDVKRRETKEI